MRLLKNDINDVQSKLLVEQDKLGIATDEKTKAEELAVCYHDGAANNRTLSNIKGSNTITLCRNVTKRRDPFRQPKALSEPPNVSQTIPKKRLPKSPNLKNPMLANAPRSPSK